MVNETIDSLEERIANDAKRTPLERLRSIQHAIVPSFESATRTLLFAGLLTGAYLSANRAIDHSIYLSDVNSAQQHLDSYLELDDGPLDDAVLDRVRSAINTTRYEPFVKDLDGFNEDLDMIESMNGTVPDDYLREELTELSDGLDRRTNAFNYGILAAGLAALSIGVAYRSAGEYVPDPISDRIRQANRYSDSLEKLKLFEGSGHEDEVAAYLGDLYDRGIPAWQAESNIEDLARELNYEGFSDALASLDDDRSVFLQFLDHKDRAARRWRAPGDLAELSEAYFDALEQRDDALVRADYTTIVTLLKDSYAPELEDTYRKIFSDPETFSDPYEVFKEFNK